MLDLTKVPQGVLDPIALVIAAVLADADGLTSDDVMLVGAACRDVLHHAQSHTFDTTLTRDLDIALALSSWDAFHSIAAAFPRVGDTGIRFRIAGVDVDLLPFGDVEDPEGFVEPPIRQEPMSVWAFEEIYAASLPLPLSSNVTIRLPTVAGFAAAKVGAWLDRSEWRETKDAGDLALILHWYGESADVADRLYATTDGTEVLIEEQADVALAAAHLLGMDIAETIGTTRLTELLPRWPGNADLLVRELTLRGGHNWPREPERRREVIDALTRGLEYRQAQSRSLPTIE